MEKHVHPHTLRHSYATGLVERRFTMPKIKLLLGHSVETNTAVYLHANPVALREKIQEKAEEGDLDHKLAEAMKALTPEAKTALLRALSAGAW